MEIALPTLEEGMQVVSPVTNSYLTQGKAYNVTGVAENLAVNNYNFYVVCDDGTKIYCALNRCGHLNKSDWEIKS